MIETSNIMRMSKQNFSFQQIISPLRSFISSKVFLTLFGFIFSIVPAAQAFDLTLAHDRSNGLVYQLSWETIDPSTTDAVVDYFVFQEFGYDGVNGVAFSSANAVAVTRETSIPLSIGNGSRCFRVVAFDSVVGGVATSDTECHGFIHNLTNEGILRGDGDGTQRGVDQLWTFTYSLDEDAYVTAKIYPPGTQFSAASFDSNRFITTPGSAPIKTLVDFTPRSSELNTHNITMSEVWDSRTSTGTIVPNGIYYLVLQATLDTGYFVGGPPDESLVVNTPETYLRDGVRYTIPVDIIRISNLSATGITLTEPTATISYDITADANVRVVIAQPGSCFIVDSTGAIQAAQCSTGAQDNSLVVSSFTFQREAGSNVESWDGTSSTGTPVVAGVYPVGISASDDYGNHAIDNSGNDFPIFTGISVERTAGSDGGDNDSDTTAPTLTSITPSNGSSTSNPVTSIQFVLADDSAGVNTSGVSFSIVDPNNNTVAGTLANSGNTFTFTPTTSLQVNGTYNVTISAIDLASNSDTFNRTFNINIRLDSDALESSLALFPNPAKNTDATIQYTLATAATVDIEIFNILGEKIYTVSVSGSQGTNSQTWDLKNKSGGRVGSGLYLVRIKASGTGGAAEALKKLVVVQ
jgi:flagellar hook assembly protein FlgD